MAGTSEAGTSRGTLNTPDGSAYDVFVSFRGPDARYDITDVLYVSMTEKGLRVFRDTEEVRNGEAIADELRRAVLDDLALRDWDISSVSPLPSSLRRLSLWRCQQSMQSGTLPGGRDYTGNMLYPIRLSNLGSLGCLCYLLLEDCECIDFSGIERMALLEELVVFKCGFEGEIPDLSNLRSLTRVKFSECDSLISLPCVVEDCRLIIEGCKKFESFDGPYRLYFMEFIRKQGEGGDSIAVVSQIDGPYRLYPNKRKRRRTGS